MRADGGGTPPAFAVRAHQAYAMVVVTEDLQGDLLEFAVELCGFPVEPLIVEISR